MFVCRTDPLTPRVELELVHVKFALPAVAPLELYWICVSAPAAPTALDPSAIVDVVTAVRRPFASYVITGTVVAEPVGPPAVIVEARVRLPVPVFRVASPPTVKPPKVPELLYWT